MTDSGQTGGSGFIAAHVLDVLLERGHSVVTTVRSAGKGQKILDNHPKVSKDKLDFVIVEDIAKRGAFDKAVQSKPPFETIIHTASPFHFNATDTQKELLDPAVIGTTGILESTKKYAPTVKRVVRLQPFSQNGIGANTSPGNHFLLCLHHLPIKRQPPRLHILRERLEPDHRRRSCSKPIQWVPRIQDFRRKSIMGIFGEREAQFHNLHHVPSACLGTNHTLSAKLGQPEYVEPKDCCAYDRKGQRGDATYRHIHLD